LTVSGCFILHNWQSGVGIKIIAHRNLCWQYYYIFANFKASICFMV